MPEFLSETIGGMDQTQSGIVLLIGYLFAPFFLIMPLMFSTVIAAESFAGERERKTIEALLYTPATDTELFLGKVLAAFTPAVLITWGGFIAYMHRCERSRLSCHEPHLVPAAELVPAHFVGFPCHLAAWGRRHGFDLCQSAHDHGGLPVQRIACTAGAAAAGRSSHGYSLPERLDRDTDRVGIVDH